MDGFGWKYTGRHRPGFALEPGPGQESVWDYPRPPRIEPFAGEVVVEAGGVRVAQSRRAVRVLETASPPTFYLPPTDIAAGRLEPVTGSSYCEWKGAARYWTVVAGPARLERAAWSYPAPTPAFAALAGFVSFYPAVVACYVDGERVRPQPGGFYGGWLTDAIVGPVKGEPGTSGW